MAWAAMAEKMTPTTPHSFLWNCSMPHIPEGAYAQFFAAALRTPRTSMMRPPPVVLYKQEARPLALAAMRQGAGASVAAPAERGVVAAQQRGDSRSATPHHARDTSAADKPADDTADLASGLGGVRRAAGSRRWWARVGGRGPAA